MRLGAVAGALMVDRTPEAMQTRLAAALRPLAPVADAGGAKRAVEDHASFLEP